jgi:glycosyltransferase involved in cell wall biosynthesis
MARVLFLMTHPFQQWKNGADIAAVAIAHQLRARGHECAMHVIVRDGEYRAPPDARVVRLPAEPSGDPFVVARAVMDSLNSAIERAVAGFDAVIVHWGSATLAKMARAHHPRVMVMVQNGEAVLSMTPDAYRGLTVGTVSPRMAASIARALGEEPLVILNPIDLPIADDGPHDAIGMVNICGEKGAVLFLNCAANLPSHKFVATGGWAGDAKLFAEMATGLANVEILPPLDDMSLFYRRVRTVLMPSLWPEAFGRVAMEAQLRGIPVLCSDRCAVADMIDGIVVPLGERPPGITNAAYYRDGAHHVDGIKAFLDAIVTVDDPDNYAVLQRRARASGARYLEAQRKSLDGLERWILGGHSAGA